MIQFKTIDGLLLRDMAMAGAAILEKNHVKLTDLVSGRQLNPLGANDVITFPRLNKIGYFAGPGDTVRFSGITISNVREPGRVITEACPGGTVLSGVDENGQEAGCQTVFDPSCHSLPMFRRYLPAFR